MGRDITKCHPEIQEKAQQLMETCAKRGLYIGISECFRTVEEQNELYAQGRTKPGNIVTNAKGSSYSSHHQWGTAFDFYRNDGKGAYNDGDGFFSMVGRIGKQLGLEWGGDWISPVDKPHFQLPYWGSSTAMLKTQYGTPEKFKKAWEEEDEVVEVSSLEIDGKIVPVKRILKDGTNYIAIRDVAAVMGYKVGNRGNIAVLTKD